PLKAGSSKEVSVERPMRVRAAIGVAAAAAPGGIAAGAPAVVALGALIGAKFAAPIDAATELPNVAPMGAVVPAPLPLEPRVKHAVARQTERRAVPRPRRFD